MSVLRNHPGIGIQKHKPVPLQPGLEADVLTGRRRPVPTREVTLTPRPAKRPHRSRLLEPGRHTVQQRTPQPLAHSVHVRQLNVRLRTIHPSRYSHPAPQRDHPNG